MGKFLRLSEWSPHNLLAPNECLFCREIPSAPLCATCLSDLEPAWRNGCQRCGNPEVHSDAVDCWWCRRLKQLPDRIFSAYLYRGRGRQLFQKIKFDGYWRLLPILMADSTLSQAIQNSLKELEAIAPIPESLSRRLKRHFNPAALIARELADRTGIPIYNGLRTPFFTKRQVGLSYEDRRRNVRNKFSLGKRGLPGSVVLVDDVLTTGATLEAATALLKKAGVAEVVWFTLFRTIDH